MPDPVSATRPAFTSTDAEAAQKVFAPNDCLATRLLRMALMAPQSSGLARDLASAACDAVGLRRDGYAEACETLVRLIGAERDAALVRAATNLSAPGAGDTLMLARRLGEMLDQCHWHRAQQEEDVTVSKARRDGAES